MVISILTTIDNPMAGIMIKSFLNNFHIDSIIADCKPEKEKDKIIWERRTKGQIKNIPLNDFSRKVKIIKMKNHNSQELYDLTLKREIDLFINCGTPRILSERIISVPKIGILNCHPGILPNYRGCSSVEWSLYNDDDVGNTAHLMKKEIDEGPIILIEKLDTSKYDTYQDIRIANYLDSINVIIKAVNILSVKKINFQNYPKNGNYYKPIDDKKLKLVMEKFT